MDIIVQKIKEYIYQTRTQDIEFKISELSELKEEIDFHIEKLQEQKDKEMCKVILFSGTFLFRCNRKEAENFKDFLHCPYCGKLLQEDKK